MDQLFKMASQSASQVASQTSNEESGIFDKALSGLLGNIGSHKPAEPEEIQQAQDNYQQLVNDPTQPASPEAIGNAAAVQAMHQNEQQSNGTLGTLLGFAMAIASKLFGISNGPAATGAGKESAIQQAAMMAFKLYLGKQAGGSQGSAVSSLLGFAMNMSGGGGQQQDSSLGMIGNLMGSFIGGGQQQQQPQQSNNVMGLLSKLI